MNKAWDKLPDMAKTIISIILVVVVIVLTYYLFRSIKGIAKGNPVTQIQDGINNKTLLSNAKKNLSPSRKNALSQLAKAVLQDMEGIGTYDNDFQRHLLTINTDEEFIYFQAVFGAPNGSNLREWINGEFMLEGKLLWINIEYKKRGMSTRL